MQRFRQLLVALGRTEADAGLIRYAALAARLGLAQDVRFVHVLSRRPGGARTAVREQVSAELQAQVWAHFTGVPQTVRLHYDVLEGSLLPCLLALVAERQADIVCVGRGHDPRQPAALARRLTREAPCSVWTVPENPPPSLSRILVPIDYSVRAADCLQVALSLARRSARTECLVLHVRFNEALVTYADYAEVTRREEEEEYQRFLALLDCRGVWVTPLFEEGASVARAIHRAAQKHAAELIVMATRGRSRLAALLLGSNTDEAIRDAHVPVLAVKHFGARLGLLQALRDRRFRRRSGPRFN
jgi:nucleotide-binding universal stress UspA family protein